MRRLLHRSLLSLPIPLPSPLVPLKTEMGEMKREGITSLMKRNEGMKIETSNETNE